MKLFIYLSIFILAFINPALAIDDIIQLNTQGVSVNPTPAQARAESLKDALDKGTLQVLSNLIGEARVEKNMAAIKEKILIDTSKYVQYFKAEEPVKLEDQTTVQVNMKISVASLRELLDKEGLLIQSDEVFDVLPVVKIYEKSVGGRSYQWWKDDPQFISSVLKDQLRALALQFQQTKTKNFKLVDPIKDKTYLQVSDRFKIDDINSTDAITMAAELKMPLLLLGEAYITPTEVENKYKAALKSALYHVQSSRVVAEINKEFELTSNKKNSDLILQQALRQVYTDASNALSEELLKEFKKGLFGSQVIQILIDANMNYFDLENIKKEFLVRIPELRSIKERKLQKGNFTLEADLIGNMNSLAKKIETSSFDKIEVNVDRVEPQFIKLSVSKKRGG
ncbi:MAG: hypothetical protein IPM57_05730 [Oligoflexia bacterium]|nr:hypothetical protein [Oligoflexia bacterium]